MHIYVNYYGILRSDNAQAKPSFVRMLTYYIMLMNLLETKFSKIWIKTQKISYKNIHLKKITASGGHFVLASHCINSLAPNKKSRLVQVMAWCRQATSHYLSQCRPRCCHMSSPSHNELKQDILPQNKQDFCFSFGTSIFFFISISIISQLITR